MDSKKMAVMLVAAIVVVGAVGAFVYLNNDDRNNDKETISIAYLNLGYYPFMVGFSQGWFDDLDFNVEPVVVNGSGQDAVNAVLAGEATMAATGDAPFVNTLGAYPDNIIGLAQYTQSTGSLGGHRWITTSDNSSLLDQVAVTDGTSTNSQAVADQIKQISANDQGGTDGQFTVAMVQGSTTQTNFKKWCLAYGLTYDEDGSNPDADVRIVGLLNVDASVLITSLETAEVDALAVNNSYYSQISSQLGDRIYVFGDSSSLTETSYSVLCTTAANYERYQIQMMQVLEVLKEICDWIKANPEQAAQICSSISGATESSILSSINSSSYQVTWETQNYDSWLSTAAVNGYTDLTAESFIQACPHRDIINGWYSQSS